MSARIGRAAAVLLILFAAAASGALAEGRTVYGTVVRVSETDRFLTVKDAAGASWNYRVDPDAGIDLSAVRAGDRVAVTIARPTPLNMITPADRLRKGDRVEKAGR